MLLFLSDLLLHRIIQIKMGNNSLIGYSDIVQVLLYPAIPAVVEVLVEVVDPVPHHSLSGELSLALAEVEPLTLIHRGNLPVVAEGHGLT